MADTNRKPASEILRSEAAVQEKTLLSMNEYQDNTGYDATKVPQEIDGAMVERNRLNAMNFYNEDSIYKNPDGSL